MSGPSAGGILLTRRKWWNRNVYRTCGGMDVGYRRAAMKGISGIALQGDKFGCRIVAEMVCGHWRRVSMARGKELEDG